MQHSKKWVRTDIVKSDRAIELSEWSHVELALYARGLEIDRRQLIALVQFVKQELADLHRQDGMPARAAAKIEQLMIALDGGCEAIL